MKHRTKIVGYSGDLRDLAEDIGNLRYDSLHKFLDLLSEKFRGDAIKDFAADRKQLSDKLIRAASKTEEARDVIDDAWLISRIHMDIDNEEST